MGSVFILDPFFNLINVQRQARFAVIIEDLHEQVMSVVAQQQLQRVALVIVRVLEIAQKLHYSYGLAQWTMLGRLPELLLP